MAGDPRIRGLDRYFAGGSPTTREERLWALVGRAATGAPVASELAAYGDLAGASIDERIALALAATAAGDDTLAGRLLADILRQSGEQQGPWVRIASAAGDDADTVRTARLAIVAAWLGLPVAADMDAYVDAHPPKTTVIDLERALAAQGWVRRLPASDAVAALMGLYLVSVGGWPILLLGVLSILSGWAYTGGPLPIAYTPLGELFVIAFFGVGAVGGTYWLCTAYLGAAALEAGLALGLLTGAVLLVNNYRDVEADTRVGRRTLAIMAGPQGTAWIYAGLMLLPFTLLLPIGHSLPRGHVWPALAALPLVLALIYRFTHEPHGRGFNRILIWTVQLQCLFGLLLGVGLIL